MSFIDDLKGIAQHFSDTAKSTLSKGEEIPSVVAIVTPDKNIGVGMLPYRNETEKHAMYAAVREKAKAAKAVAMIVVADTYYRTVATQKEVDDSPRPSRCADRKEALLVICYSATGWNYMIREKYHREDGVVVWDGVDEEENTKADDNLLRPQEVFAAAQGQPW